MFLSLIFLAGSFAATEFAHISLPFAWQHFSHMSCLGLGGWLTEQGRSSQPTFIYHHPTLADLGQLPLLCSGTDGAGEEKG